MMLLSQYSGGERVYYPFENDDFIGEIGRLFTTTMTSND
jgi:hypothetical protein